MYYVIHRNYKLSVCVDPIDATRIEWISASFDVRVAPLAHIKFSPVLRPKQYPLNFILFKFNFPTY